MCRVSNGIGKAPFGQPGHGVTKSADTWQEKTRRFPDLPRIARKLEWDAQMAQRLTDTEQVAATVIDNMYHCRIGTSCSARTALNCGTVHVL